MFFPSLLSLIPLLPFLQPALALDAWHLDSISVLVNEQIDPIVNVNQQGTHMHKVLGGSGFSAAYNFATYKNAKCSSLAISADKSNYWMPNLYARLPSNNKFVAVPVVARFYYFLGRNSPSEPVQAFPEGLRMLVGDPMAKKQVGQYAFQCQTAAASGPYGENFNFDTTCDWGMKTEVFFPPCWDGVNLYRADQSHMSYPLNSANSGSCPISHPVRLPAIMLEYTWHVERVMPNTPMKGNLFWANGDSTGFGIHADFVNGWDTAVLTKALTSPGCAIGADNAITMTDCDVFKPYVQSQQDMANCKPDQGTLLEPTGNDDGILLDSLPGCNPPWGDTPDKPSCPSPAPQLNMRGLTGTNGPLVADPSAQFHLPYPTTPGWQEVACVREIASVQGGVYYVDPGLSPKSCTDSCSKAGYTWAGVGQVGQNNFNCVCGNSFDQNANYMPGSCTTPCPGDSTKMCGASYIFNVYQAGPGTTLTLPRTSDGSEVLGYSLPSDRSQGLQAAATYRFNSDTMTREFCIKACKEIGSNWAYTSSWNSCSCGKDFSLAPGSFVPDSFCGVTCNGNSSQICGDYYRAIVYNIANSTVGAHPAPVVEGSQGCFNPSPFISSSRFSYNSNSMTTGLCRRTCKSRKFAYAGLTSGNQCYCSNTAPASSDTVAPAICNNPCNGAGDQFCGAQNNIAIGVFDTTGAGAQPPAGYPADYVGCVNDANPRVLPGYTFNSNSLTSTQCRDVCTSYGYSVYGTEYSFQCFCGSNLGGPGLIPDSSCDSGCAGNSAERCGGAYILSIYDVNQVSTPNSPSPSPSPSSTASPTSTPSPTTNNMAVSPTTSPSSTTTTTTTTASPSPSPDTPAVPGCYSSTNAGIASNLITSTTMTSAMCRMWCGANGYTYALMSAGNSCGCRSNLLSLARVADSQCSSPCSGASKSLCGGPAGSTSYFSVISAPAKGGLCGRSEARRANWR